MDISKLKDLFNDFNSSNIIIIGDVMIDAYIWGDVNRISPEAPVPVLSGNLRENRLGGAANVALNIKALGANPILCSIIGKDQKSEIFTGLLDKLNLTNEGILCREDRRTTVKTRLISNNQHLLRVDEEDTGIINNDIEKEFIHNIKEIISSKKIDAIVFEDYDKGVITENIIKEITAIANENKIVTTVDPKKRNFKYYKNITLFKPNFKEFTEGIGKSFVKSDIDTMFKESVKFISENKIDNMFVTLSENGVFICSEGDYHVQPTEIRDIVDVSGAGDTVISISTLCLSKNISKKDIAIMSNIAGGLVCEKVGVVPINKDQLLLECMKFYGSK